MHTVLKVDERLWSRLMPSRASHVAVLPAGSCDQVCQSEALRVNEITVAFVRSLIW